MMKFNWTSTFTTPYSGKGSLVIDADTIEQALTRIRRMLPEATIIGIVRRVN